MIGRKSRISVNNHQAQEWWIIRVYNVGVWDVHVQIFGNGQGNRGKIVRGQHKKSSGEDVKVSSGLATHRWYVRGLQSRSSQMDRDSFGSATQCGYAWKPMAKPSQIDRDSYGFGSQLKVCLVVDIQSFGWIGNRQRSAVHCEYVWVQLFGSSILGSSTVYVYL